MNNDSYATNAFIVILLGCAIVAYFTHTDIDTIFALLSKLAAPK